MVEEVIPVLRVADAAAAVRWYERLGFAQQREHRFEPGMPHSCRSRVAGRDGQRPWRRVRECVDLG